ARLRPLSSAHASPSTASPLLPYTTLFRSNLVGDPHRYDVTAAVPSLHVAFPLLCIFTVLRYGLPRVIAFGLALNTLGVVFAIVYMGEHYLVDGIAGAVYAVATWWLVTRLLGREVASPGPVVAVDA